MKAKQLLAAVLSAATALCAIPFTAQAAAAATVQEIDSVRTAFVSSFGRISYNGKTYTSYKTFDESLAAL